MSTNTRERKRKKEFQRGFIAGDEGRKKQANEVRVQRGSYWDGYQSGATQRYARITETEDRRKRYAEAKSDDERNGIAGEGPI